MPARCGTNCAATGSAGRAGRPVARCTLERLMRHLGPRRGAPRPAGDHHPPRQAGRSGTDLVDRDFTAARPSQLWVVDMTYVPTWSGTVFIAFVSNMYSRRVVGSRCASRMPTELGLDTQVALNSSNRAAAAVSVGAVQTGRRSRAIWSQYLRLA